MNTRVIFKFKSEEARQEYISRNTLHHWAKTVGPNQRMEGVFDKDQRLIKVFRLSDRQRLAQGKRMVLMAKFEVAKFVDLEGKLEKPRTRVDLSFNVNADAAKHELSLAYANLQQATARFNAAVAAMKGEVNV